MDSSRESGGFFVVEILVAEAAAYEVCRNPDKLDSEDRELYVKVHCLASTAFHRVSQRFAEEAR
jgi:hypothetical protein